jgi:hypothetical protein
MKMVLALLFTIFLAVASASSDDKGPAITHKVFFDVEVSE